MVSLTLDDIKRGIKRRVAEHQEFIWLLTLALVFRLFAVLLLAPGGNIYDGLAGSDYNFYKKIGELSLQGYYPSVHYWLEYPPVYSWIIIGIYRLSLFFPAVPNSMFWFQNLLGIFLSFVDAGSLILVYLIQLRLTNRRIALRSAWMYALLFWPLYVVISWFDPFPVFMMMLTVYGLVSNRPLLTGVSAGIGFMTKVVPAVVAVVALRAFDLPKRFLASAIAGVLTVVVVALPFLLHNASMLLWGFQSSLSRSSWETVWALLDDYYSVGVVSPIGTHFDGATVSWQSHGTNLPWSLVTLMMVGLGVVAVVTVGRRSPKTIVGLSGFMVTLLFLFSKGFSPQFLAYLLPFVVLLLPNGWGVLLAILLTWTNVLDHPIGMELFKSQVWELWAAIGARTALMVVLAIVCYINVQNGAPPWLTRWWKRARIPVVVAVVIGVIGMGWTIQAAVVQTQVESRYYELQKYLLSLSVANQGVVLSNVNVAADVYPNVNGAPVYVLPYDWELKRDEVKADLLNFVSEHSQIWLILDYSKGGEPGQEFLRTTLDDCMDASSTNRLFQDYRLFGYSKAENLSGESWKSARTTFDQKLRLTGYSVAESYDNGKPFRLSLRWEVDGSLDGNYSLFVHVVSSNGEILAQRDKVLTQKGKGTSQWNAGEVVFDATDILLPDDAMSGSYELRVGLYRPGDGVRLKREDGSDYLLLGQIRVENLAK